MKFYTNNWASPVDSSYWFVCTIVANRKIFSSENIDLKISYFLVNMPSDSVMLSAGNIKNKTLLFRLKYGWISCGCIEKEQLVTSYLDSPLLTQKNSLNHEACN